MHVRCGTSGYSYPEWRGGFYPADLAAADMLRHYATRLPAVEINNTFYRMPRSSVVESWGSQVPDSFRFVLKASRRITHFKRLKDTGEEVDFLLRSATKLQARLGAILFQLPPNLPKDLDRLRDFLGLIPHDVAAAVEFRHASWFEEDVFATLRRRNVALCIVDPEADNSGKAGPRSLPDPEALLEASAWGYLRLRRDDYGEAELDRWAGRIRACAGWEQAYVFFKHEEDSAGALLAVRLQQRFDGEAPAVAKTRRRTPPQRRAKTPAARRGRSGRTSAKKK